MTVYAHIDFKWKRKVVVAVNADWSLCQGGAPDANDGCLFIIWDIMGGQYPIRLIEQGPRQKGSWQ